MNYAEQYKAYQDLIEAQLSTFFPSNRRPEKKLLQAMRYSLMAGGKRVRPILTLGFCAASGAPAERGLAFACAVEMLHTYSLIHDDLPCMDDDDLRRGKPTNHVVYGMATAILAGDALQAEAFSTLLSAPLSPDILCRAGQVLARAAGILGICAGQQLDLEGEGQALSLGAVSRIHQMKTASMISAAAVLGCLAGSATGMQIAAAEQYANSIGMAFQIMDDILDAESTAQELGKPIGSDAANQKSTFYTLLGPEKSRAIVTEETEKAKASIQDQFQDPGFLLWLADWLARRTN